MEYNTTYQSNTNNLSKPQSLAGLVRSFKKNFLERSIEIVPGLNHNQYEVVKRVYFYIHNQFESGPFDDNGDPKYFYDLITHRNDQATKNIQLDTKDVYIQSETQGSYMKSWLLRREYSHYAKSTAWGKKLNTLADDLPDFGTVVWKKVKHSGKTDISQVELINIMNDPAVDCLKDGMMMERHFLTQSDMRSMKSWNQDKVEDLIKSGKTTPKTAFLDNSGATGTSIAGTQIDESTPYYEMYEVWGEIPYTLYEKYKTGGIKRPETVSYLKKPEKQSESSYGIRTSPHYKQDAMPKETTGAKSGGSSVAVESYSKNNDSVYVMAIVGGVRDGGFECVPFCKEVDREQFPYKEVHYRRRKGRWLGVGNYEQCFPLIEKANEVTNRFFASLRIALLHLYQTRDQLHVKNVMTDLLDGDVVVSKSELTAIPTEIRGANEYKIEMNSIETLADKLCNSYEIVSGADLPSGTPFKLGAQQLKSATKLFEYVQQNMGLFIEEVFNQWMLKDFAKSLTKEHILDLLDDADDIQVYYTAKRKMFQYQVMKQYILEHSEFPDPEQLKLVGELVKDQVSKGPKQVKVEQDAYANIEYTIKVVVTGENDAKKEHVETLSTAFQTIAANPAGLQDPRLMKIFNLLLEQTGYSPLEINAINEAPVNESLNPANQGGGGADRSMLEASAKGSVSRETAPVGA